ncbi:13367_t:CDS:2 [Gigaspora margarita]|uniref:13367_t:CDS:1 n=1 Tax=Gigaspora margarita TaxID=4874 RepID=A0ABN7ULK4_GIGMA|nr:13367_t:CDS:2 [Gigaspora margarita]
MSATQSMNTSSEDTTDHQNIQTIESMDIDGLPKHAAKKVKASTSSENDTLITTSPLSTQMMLIQNDKKMEPPKNSTIVLPSEKDSIPHKKTHGTDLPGMKFSHDNSYIVIAPAADFYNDQDITMQQCDQTQDTQKVIEHAQETTIDEMGNIEETRKAVLEMDTDTNSNTTIEGTEIPHRSYSSVLKNKDQILQEMEAVDSTGWPNIVKTRLNNKHKALHKTICKHLIEEITEEFQIPEPLLLSYTNINYTNKPNLLEDPNHIIGMGLVTPIRDPKMLIIEPTGTSTKSIKPALPNDLDTLLEKLRNTEDTLNIPITDYSELNDTLE